MNLFKKIALSLTATSMVVAPVAASAAPAIAAVSFDDVASVSAVEGQSELEGRSWIFILLAIAAGVGLYFILDDDDGPTSP